MLLAALVVAFVSCQSNGKKSEEQAVESKAAIVEAGTHEPDSVGYIVRVGDIAPELEMELTDGQKVKLSDLRGKVVMLQFTASWCGVCRKEMPFIERDIWLKLKDNPEFALYGIDLKEDAKTTAAFAELIPISYPLTLDLEGKTFEVFCAEGAGVTRNIILDREGKIIMLTRLFDEAEFKQMVEVINAELAK